MGFLRGSVATLGRSELAELTWARVGDGGRRHGDGNANTAAAAVLPAAASPAASAEGGRRERGHASFRATCSDGCTADMKRYYSNTSLFRVSPSSLIVSVCWPELPAEQSVRNSKT